MSTKISGERQGTEKQQKARNLAAEEAVKQKKSK